MNRYARRKPRAVKTNRCPFCTSSTTGLVRYPGNLFFVTCYNCNAQGPRISNQSIAVMLWNRLKVTPIDPADGLGLRVIARSK